MGHMARARTDAGLDEASFDINPTLSDPGLRHRLKRVLNAVRPEVELILDIHGPPDWVFQTQPGAM